MTVHTPGPWRVAQRFDIYQDTQLPGGGIYVGTTRGNGDLPEHIAMADEANAILMAAAPCLLAALCDLIDACELPGDHNEIEQALRPAITAIEKAIMPEVNE